MRKILLFAGLILLVFLSLSCAKSKAPQRPALSKKQVLPLKLGGLSMTNKISGMAAIKEISSLHSLSNIAIKDAYVANYGANNQVTVWLSVANNYNDNQKLQSQMTNKINQGRSPFSKPTSKSIDNLKVYELTGMGQNHYYYASGKKLVWLAVNSPIAKTVFSDLITKVK